ncbi:hypothetical protein SSBR45G_16070 [Bradyrhizobium sp. SSBR45G]|uniref:cytoplasmic protein n=1 Tax=unclassified Bradyrhizobium TaxID=2631580 RepID=UPI002342B780|nr:MULTISPECIES: cytoplasmic protein [unclassified Bradyrhizobium]GLH76699.1 hypothetical protein SSBR45G_16070 [Bradyrhizobium sp. SSBR45G]GLH84312.1 hypothetical protein SSBR45R_17720 [Bradyrhizobium sp. SSBR45R]
MSDLPDDHPLKLAHRRSIRHRAEIEASRLCGCFYCERIFVVPLIVDWIHEDDTARCPFCGIDSVLGDASGFPITAAFLREMRGAWFGLNPRQSGTSAGPGVEPAG